MPAFKPRFEPASDPRFEHLDSGFRDILNKVSATISIIDFLGTVVLLSQVPRDENVRTIADILAWMVRAERISATNLDLLVDILKACSHNRTADEVAAFQRKKMAQSMSTALEHHHHHRDPLNKEFLALLHVVSCCVSFIECRGAFLILAKIPFEEELYSIADIMVWMIRTNYISATNLGPLINIIQKCGYVSYPRELAAFQEKARSISGTVATPDHPVDPLDDAFREMLVDVAFKIAPDKVGICKYLASISQCASGLSMADVFARMIHTNYISATNVDPLIEILCMCQHQAVAETVKAFQKRVRATTTPTAAV